MLPKDPFKQFQEELAALEARKNQPELSPMEKAKAEFLTLKRRYGLHVADVISFFPEEEGVAYLEELMSAPKPKQRAAKKTKA